MKNVLLRTIAGTGLLLFGLSAGMAQDRDRDRGRDRDRDDTYYQSRDTFFRDQRWKARLFERVRDDLDRVQASTFPVSRDEFRIAKTKQELNELQSKLAAGRYDQPELDDAISSLQKVVDSNKLSPRDREMLADDLNRMRDYREHHENWNR
jgi:hypothetical protein